MKKLISALAIPALLLAFTGCSQATAAEAQTLSASGDEMFSSRDLEQGYDSESAVDILLEGDGASITGEGAEASGSVVTITKEGCYHISGSLLDGMVIVDAGETDKVQLVLDAAEIHSSTSAAIYVRQADKVFITTASGSASSLSNGGAFTAIDENNIDAVVFSKADLTLNGEGSLEISSPGGHGIVSKDDLTLTGGSFELEVSGHGLSANDSIAIAGGSLTIVSSKDAIQAENDEDSSLGYVYISGGSFSLQAGGDGISAGAYIQILEGDYDIYTGEGSASVSMSSGSGQPWTYDSSAEDSSPSQKGLKAEGQILISGGSLTCDTADDCLHAGGDIQISGGSFSLQSGDDAIHSDAAVEIQDGGFQILYCYEGIEGLSLTIDGGSFHISSVDDGLNAAGGADSSGFWGGRPGQDSFGSTSDSFITINGGDFVIVSQGDCIDSNGDLTINGGSLDLTCNSSYNTALDCDGSYSNNGGSVTTNDGSESSPGSLVSPMREGGMEGQGGMGHMDRQSGMQGDRQNGMGGPGHGGW